MNCSFSHFEASIVSKTLILERIFVPRLIIIAFSGTSAETGFDWTALTTEEKGPVTYETVDIWIPHHSTRTVKQVIGTCGPHTIRTSMKIEEH